MPLHEAVILGKGGFLIDLVQLVIGSTIGLIILGVVVGLVVVVYIVSKVLNVQEARQNAANPNAGEGETNTVNLNKTE